MSEFITIKEAAKIVNISGTSIYRWAKKLPKSQVKNQRPFLVSKNMLLSYYNTSKTTQKSKQNTDGKQLIINKLENSTKDFNVKSKVNLSDDDKAFFQAQIKEQNVIIQGLQNANQDLQNANHNLLLLVGAKEKQVSNLLNQVNQNSNKLEQHEKQIIYMQKDTSKTVNSDSFVMFFVGAVALLISLAIILLFFN